MLTKGYEVGRPLLATWVVDKGTNTKVKQERINFGN